MRNEATVCRVNSISCSDCSSAWSTSCCYIFSAFSSRSVFFITNTWLYWRNYNCWFGTILLEHFLFLYWSKGTCTRIDLVACCLLNNIIAFFEVFNLIFSWHFDHRRNWLFDDGFVLMRNEATICRINRVGGSYCSCTWNTSYCDFCFTFGSCGVFFITNTWLKWCNHNFRFGTFWIGNVFPYCWSKSTCTGIDRVSGCLLNNIITVFEVLNLIFGWNSDHRRSWLFDDGFALMRNEATICRIHSISCSDCSSAWSTSCYYIFSAFSSRNVFFITNTWL